MRGVCFASLLCLMASASLDAAEITKQIPGDAYGYIAVSDAQALDSKIQTLGQRMQLPIPSFLGMMATQPDVAKTLDTTGTTVVAFLPAENPDERHVSIVVVVPVNDYDGLKGQLENASNESGITEGLFNGKKLCLAKKGTHAIVAQTEDRFALEKVLKYEVSSGSEIAQPENEYDIALLMTTHGLEEVTVAAQQGLREMMRVFAEQAGEDNPALAGLRMYDNMFTYMREELDAFSVTLRIDESSSLRVTKNLWVKPTSQFASLLKDIPDSRKDLLPGIPDGPFVVAVGATIPEGGFKKMLDLSAVMMRSMPQVYNMTPTQIDQMIELSKKYFKSFDGMAFVLGVGEPGTPVYGKAAVTMVVPDANQYLDDYVSYWNELEAKMEGADIPFLDGINVEEVTLQGHRALKITMPFDQMTQVPPEQKAMVNAMMVKMFGANELVMYAGAVDAKTVLIGYTSPDMLVAAWESDGKSASLSESEYIKTTSAMLPSSPQFVGYWSPSGTATFASQLISEISPQGFQLPEFPATPPVGWTVEIKSGQVEANAVIPVEVFEAAGKFASGFIKMRN
ncbi:hypothetical protein LOC67_06915 [Stieleria sp. JC731]|uniref:hypothetical protein n=1 Tax=Pirellulaceae TaxID=2691357 RepID=UPI001E43916C|nr:hypothetical protein [Stieleria sp. JC731]MCC9600287.1 hypothetical protein [Stieleria sp. JC731]